MIARCFALALAGVTAGPLSLRAADTTPDFKEVQQLVREHLAGATDETVNRAAVDGLLTALKGRVTVVTNPAEAAESTNAAPLVSRPGIYDGGIAHVRIGGVAAGLASAIRAAVADLGATNKLNGLVLDLRFAAGSDYAAAAAVVDLFLKSEVPLMNAGKGLVSSRDKTNAIRLPVVALVNGETGAAAEALAAALRHAGAGLLIGSRTAGRAGVTSDFKLSNGQTVRIVTAPVLLGDAKPVPSTGVMPDIEVAVGADDELAFYEDSFFGSGGKANSGENATTNTTSAARNGKRIRVTEADLVREKRGDGDFETVTNARVKSEAEVPVIQDPALARAVDLLKGLAVVRQGKS